MTRNCFAFFVLFLSFVCRAADEHPDSVCVLGTKVPYIAVQPVKGFGQSKSNPIDTIATAAPGVSVVLFNDNSWKYLKTSEYIERRGNFSENWDTKITNPYHSPIDSLPETWSIWLVDSLGDYHVPQTGRVTSKFGIRWGRSHQGVDISIPIGMPLYAAFDGKVRVSTQMKGYGQIIIIRHDNGLETFYGHMSRRDVASGDIVHAGDIIGLSGNTGRSTGPHLHFETRYNGLAFDPQRIVNFDNGDLKQRIMVLKRRYFSASSRYDQNFDDEYLNEEDDKKALEEKKKRDAEAARKAMVYHKVRSGECLSTIARRYGTSVNTICRLNGISANSILSVGKIIRVR